jgi:hypothetical protein
MGVLAYLAQVTMSPEATQELPENQRLLYQSNPAWDTLVGILVQLYHSFFICNSFEVFGPGGLIMPVMVVIIGVLLIWLSRKATSQNWLN